MYVLTVEQMRAAEAKADANGLSYAQMMERAGKAVALALDAIESVAGRRVLILVGPGNNGGDGLVAACHLQQMGASVTCYTWNRERPDDDLLKAASAAGCSIRKAEEDAGWATLREECQAADVIVDALLGTGAGRPIGGMLADLLQVTRACFIARRCPERASGEMPRLLDPLVNSREPAVAPLVLAVDVPSGLNCDTGAADPATLPADVTITLGFPKRGLFRFPGAALVGKLLIGDIGISPDWVPNPNVHLVTAEMVAGKLPARPRNAHKGTFGKALIVAGSANYIGAPALAASAAMRVGAGLVTLALADRIYPIVSAKLTEVTYLILPHVMGALIPDAIRVLSEHLDNYQALLIGPGLGQEKETVRFVTEFLAGRKRTRPASRSRIGFVPNESEADEGKREDAGWTLPPLVIDADALNALAQMDGWYRNIPAGSILTPHPGEMARLLKCDRGALEGDRVALAQQAAQEWNQIVLLKGAYSVLASPDGQAYILPFANPVLATAGTGDVLAGAIVGLLAQGLDPLDAAMVGGFLHGLAAEEMEYSQEQSAGSVAGDLLPFLPAAIRALTG